MKKKIVLASVLKPVDDTRMYEKFGISLSQTNKYDINIIGFSSKNILTYQSISFHPLFNFKRLSYKRITASWKYYKKLLKVKPDIIIVTTAELLIVSVYYKILFGSKLLYDVQENYYRNIRYGPAFPTWARPVLAASVRAVEYLTRPWIDHYFLAERAYVKELGFNRNKSVVIENKYKPLSTPVHKSKPTIGKTVLLYSGTIAENYGIFEAIKFTNSISEYEPGIILKIIGYCAHGSTIKKLKEAIKRNENIELIGGNELVPHHLIIQAIQQAHFAIVPYQPDKSIQNRFPTKIYEYLAHQLPMIIQNHKLWVEYCQKYQSCIPIDFKNYNPELVLNKMKTCKFYPKGISNEIFWENEELTLINVIDDIK